MSASVSDRRSLVAYAVVAAGLTGTVIDNDGTAGAILFAAAAAALLYLVARPVLRRARTASPTRVPLLISGRAIAATSLAGGALLGASNAFSAGDDAALGRVLNDVTFLSGAGLVAVLALVALGSAILWIRSAVAA